MHIAYCYDLPLPSPYAASIQMLNTSHALCELGARVTLYTNRIAAPTIAAALAPYDLTPHPNLRIVPLYDRARWSLRFDRQLQRILDRDRPSVIMSRGESGIALFERLRRLRFDQPSRLVYEAHRLADPALLSQRARIVAGGTARAAARLRAAEQRTVRAAHGVVCLTDGVRAALDAAYGLRSPTLILPSGVALPATIQSDDQRDIDVLYAGKLERRKGVYDLLAALARLPGVRAWIVGGPEAARAELQRVATRHGVDDRIVWTGTLPPRAIGALLDRARVGVCPLPLGESRIAEEFTSPLKLLEYMAHATPIVASDLPTIRTLVRHEHSAVLVPPSDPAALAAAIQRLLTDRPLARRVAHTARVEARAYSWTERARRLLEFLATL